VDRLQIVGNRIVRSDVHGLQLNSLDGPPQNVLVANNTFLGCVGSLSVYGRGAQGLTPDGARFPIHLVLRPEGLDAKYLETGGHPARGDAGDGTIVTKAMGFGRNWWEASPKEEWAERGWIPKPEGDVVKAHIDGVEREPRSPQFLRPTRNSPLATQGAGVDDPPLSRYVGALPPEDVEPWDWDRTFRALAPRTAADEKRP
jgi:hypothetical protein